MSKPERIWLSRRRLYVRDVASGAHPAIAGPQPRHPLCASAPNAAAIVGEVSAMVGARWEALVRSAGGAEQHRPLIRIAFVPPAFWYTCPEDLPLTSCINSDPRWI